MFEISAQNGLRDIILGSEGKLWIWQRTFHAIRALLKDGKIKSTVFTKPHAMKRHKSIGPMLKIVCHLALAIWSCWHQGPRIVWRLGWGVENSASKCAVRVENPVLKKTYNVEN